MIESQENQPPIDGYNDINVDKQSGENQAKPDYEIGYKKPPHKYDFKPGQPRHPNAGIKKGAKQIRTLIDMVVDLPTREDIAAKLKEYQPSLTTEVSNALAHVLVASQKALAGESWAFNFLYGMPNQTIDHTVQEKEPSPIDDLTDEEAIAANDAIERIRNGNQDTHADA